MANRQVFPTREVAHLWANRAQDSARNAQGNLFFTGARLYSYGSHYIIATFLDDGSLLWNDDSHSMTTNKHSAYARNAVRHDRFSKAIHVQTLDDSSLRDLEFCKRPECKDAKRLPMLVQSAVASVISAVQSIATRRADSTRSADFRAALEHQETAIRLLAYVARKGYKPRYPLPMLPDALPDSKAEIDALVKSIARSSILDAYAQNLEYAKQGIAQVIGQLDAAPSWSDQNLMGRVSTINRNLRDAGKHYELVHGRSSSAVTKQIRAFKPIVIRAQARADECVMRDAKGRIADAVGQFFSYVHAARSDNDSYPHQSKLRSIRRCNSWCDNSRYSEAIAHVKAIEPQWLEQFPIARMQRFSEWFDAVDILERMESERKSGDDYYNAGHLNDALSHYKRVIREFNRLDALPRFHAVFSYRLDDATAYVHSRIVELNESIRAKNAVAVETWQSGASSYLSPSAGTYARIGKLGTVVETNLGATVPIEHACRLARMARVAIRRGGQSWPDGSGPMVGHYRVSAIGADGSAEIGCHSFSADEGMRLLAILETCPACAGVAVETE